MIERASEVEINIAAPEHVAPALTRERGDALHETRGHGRRAGDLGGAGEDHFRRAQCLREIMRGQADAALGRIETEIAAHRPRQPGIAARFRRPGRFVKAAEHDAIKTQQTCFQ